MSSVKQGSFTDTSPASASTAAGSTITGLAKFDALRINASLLGATGGTLDVYLQTSFDGGATWWDLAHFPQLAAGASAVKYAIALPPAGEAGPVAIGTGTSPALAANTVVGGPWGNSIRAIYVAGASTSAGAAQTIEINGYQGIR